MILQEPWISEKTNVACLGEVSECGPEHPDFSDRLTTYNMDDDDENINWNDKGNITDYFTFDFDMSELLTLRRKQGYEFRDHLYDWQYSFITFDEYLTKSKELGFGAYVEIKHGAATEKA